jgi:hypothetical protein
MISSLIPFKNIRYLTREITWLSAEIGLDDKGRTYYAFPHGRPPLDGHLDRASDGRDGHGGFRHGVICRSVAEQAPWRRSSGPVRRRANRETHSCSLAPSHYGEAGVAHPSSAEAFFRPGLEARDYRNGLVSGESMRRSSSRDRIRLAASAQPSRGFVVLMRRPISSWLIVLRASESPSPRSIIRAKANSRRILSWELSSGWS